MKDSLKDFISQNREAFDNREPSDKVWRRVEAQLPIKDSSWWQSVTIWRAAAILFMGLSGYLFFAAENSNIKDTHANKVVVAKLQGEFSDLEKFYDDQIAQKVELINEIKDDNIEDYLSQDLSKLDAMYQVLREQMNVNPTEKVKDALILNMLIRIDLLNQQIHEIEQSRTERTNTRKDVSV
jgi:hypothetical protein